MANRRAPHLHTALHKGGLGREFHWLLGSRTAQLSHGVCGGKEEKTPKGEETPTKGSSPEKDASEDSEQETPGQEGEVPWEDQAKTQTAAEEKVLQPFLRPQQDAQAGRQAPVPRGQSSDGGFPKGRLQEGGERSGAAAEGEPTSHGGTHPRAGRPAPRHAQELEARGRRAVTHGPVPPPNPPRGTTRPESQREWDETPKRGGETNATVGYPMGVTEGAKHHHGVAIKANPAAFCSIDVFIFINYSASARV